MSDSLERILNDEELQQGDVRNAIKELNERLEVLENGGLPNKKPAAKKVAKRNGGRR